MEEEILEQTYAFFKHIVNEVGLDKFEGTGTFKTKNPRYHILGFMIDCVGFNGFPEVVEDDKFDALGGKSLYHGFGKKEFGKDFLDSFNYHYGSGFLFDGFYLTEIKSEAYRYVEDKLMREYEIVSLETQKGLTAEFKLVGANGVNESKIKEWASFFRDYEESDIFERPIRQKMTKLRKFLNSHGSEKEALSFGDLLTKINPSALAVYLGFDYLVDDVGYVVVFNRNKLAVKKSDFEKFVGTKDENPPESGLR